MCTSKRSHLGGDNGRSYGPDGRSGGAGCGPQNSVGLNSQVGGQEASLAIAAEDTELQVQVHLRTHGVASNSGTQGNACILKAVTYCSAEKHYSRQGNACDRQAAHMGCTKSRRSVAHIEELFAGVLTSVACVGVFWFYEGLGAFRKSLPYNLHYKKQKACSTVS